MIWVRVRIAFHSYLVTSSPSVKTLMRSLHLDCELDCLPPRFNSASRAAPDGARHSGCPGTWPVSTLCMTAAAQRGQLELPVPVHRPALVSSCHQTFLSSNGRSTFPFVLSLLANQAPLTEAAAQLTPPVTQSVAPQGFYFFFFLFLGHPCNPSHSCWFDTFLYKGNTSSGRIVCLFVCFIQGKVGHSGKSCGTWREFNASVMSCLISLCRWN